MKRKLKPDPRIRAVLRDAMGAEWDAFTKRLDKLNLGRNWSLFQFLDEVLTPNKTGSGNRWVILECLRISQRIFGPTNYPIYHPPIANAIREAIDEAVDPDDGWDFLEALVRWRRRCRQMTIDPLRVAMADNFGEFDKLPIAELVQRLKALGVPNVNANSARDRRIELRELLKGNKPDRKRRAKP